MNAISFGNTEGQKPSTGSALTSSLVSTGITAGVGALGGMGVAKVAGMIPPSKPTIEKVVEELYTSGDTFVKTQLDTIENANMAGICDDIMDNMDDVLTSISNTTKKGFFKKVDPAVETQNYFKNIMTAIGEKVEDGVELTKEAVKNAVQKKRASLPKGSKENLKEMIANAKKALTDKAEDFLKTHKKGDELFDKALKATHKMKKDMKLASFAKWGAIIALGLSLFAGFKPKKQKETTQA